MILTPGLQVIFPQWVSDGAFCWVRVKPTLTLFGHSHGEALLQAAVLAAVPGDLVDDAVSVTVAGVHHVFLHAAAEETLQRHTTDYPSQRKYLL